MRFTCKLCGFFFLSVILVWIFIRWNFDVITEYLTALFQTNGNVPCFLVWLWLRVRRLMMTDIMDVWKLDFMGRISATGISLTIDFIMETEDIAVSFWVGWKKKWIKRAKQRMKRVLNRHSFRDIETTNLWFTSNGSYHIVNRVPKLKHFSVLWKYLQLVWLGSRVN